jgi:hypothetical protein
MQFITVDGQLNIKIISKGTPCAKIREWRSQLQAAWLISIDGSPVSTVAEVNSALEKSLRSDNPRCTLLFSHPEIRHGLTNKGISQITLDQLNPWLLFDSFQLPTPPLYGRNCIQQVWDGEVLHYVTKAQRLTRVCLSLQDNRHEWNSSKYTHLDQYEA